MSEEARATASAGYAIGRLEQALERALTSDDLAVRRRAAARVDAWRNVLDGMASGRLTVGSRTPVADTPAWVTLEVAHGGFATGRYLAEAPLREDELARVPENAPGETDRERLNLWFLGDDGLAELGQTLRSGNYRIDVPEESALLVIAWLLEREQYAAALNLTSELRPLMHRLRFTPTFSPSSTPSGAVVRLQPVAEVRSTLRQATVRPRIAAMLETLRVWNPLYDRLVALWCDTVDDELPELTADGAVVGGWPCRVWPDDWVERRSQWLDEFHAAAEVHGRRHPKSNFARLQANRLGRAYLDFGEPLPLRERLAELRGEDSDGQHGHAGRLRGRVGAEVTLQRCRCCRSTPSSAPGCCGRSTRRVSPPRSTQPCGRLPRSCAPNRY